MTHAFNYGTAVFEGIRGNWNEDAQTTYLFPARENTSNVSARVRTSSGSR